MNRYLLQIVLLFSFISLSAQEATVGLLQYTDETANGYILLAPMLSNNTYLLNNCGEAVHTWESENNPGLSAYLLENGNLLRTERTANGIGLTGGRIVELDWEGNVVWEYNLANDSTQLHHDIEPLPNGNILAIAGRHISEQQAKKWGRNPDFVGQGGMIIDYIIEIEPLANNQANIIWQWDVKDHLVQDFDSTKVNFGNINLQKGKININYNNGVTEPVQGNGEIDFNHLNSIDYNETLDQILLSSRFFNEIWIIDHSTTTNEAASNEGGNYSNGGELLFRWGNPQAYNAGTAENQQLFGQHHASWVLNDSGEPSENIILFNNGSGRQPNYSEIIELQTSTNENGAYNFENTYLPENPTWQYVPEDTIFSRIVSGVQRLPNGNTLICDGTAGRFFEINQEEEIIWDYINPINVFGAEVQGNIPNQNPVFKVEKYPENHPAFFGKELSSGTPLEINPIDNNCVLVSNQLALTKIQNQISPTLFDKYLLINSIKNINQTFSISNINGEVIYLASFRNSIRINTQNWLSGIYFVRFENGEVIRCVKQ